VFVVYFVIDSVRKRLDTPSRARARARTLPSSVKTNFTLLGLP